MLRFRSNNPIKAKLYQRVEDSDGWNQNQAKTQPISSDRWSTVLFQQRIKQRRGLLSFLRAAAIAVLFIGYLGTLQPWRHALFGIMRTMSLPPTLFKMAANGISQHLVADAAFVLITLCYCSLVSRAYLAAAPKAGIQVFASTRGFGAATAFA